MRRRRAEATALMSLTVLTGCTVPFAAGGPVEAVLVAIFLLVAPGAAILAGSGSWPPLVRVTEVVATSVSVDVLLATALLYLGWWSPALVVGCLVVLCTCFLLPAIAGRPGARA